MLAITTSAGTKHTYFTIKFTKVRTPTDALHISKDKRWATKWRFWNCNDQRAHVRLVSIYANR